MLPLSSSASARAPSHTQPSRACLLAPPALGVSVRGRCTRRTRVLRVGALAAASGAPKTVWVRQVNEPDSQFGAVKGVDLDQSVDSFKELWVAEEKLGVRKALVSLRLVRCGSRKPTAEEEKDAVLLDDPRLSLADAGVTDGCSLLAFVAGSVPALAGGPKVSRLTISPSEFSQRWKEFQFPLDKAVLPVYACFRPPVPPPRALPAALACHVFGDFLDAAEQPLALPGRGTFREASTCAVKLLNSMPLAYEDEASRQRSLLATLSSFLGADVCPMSCGVGGLRPTTDGTVSQMLGSFRVSNLILEIKNEAGKQGDPYFQVLPYADLAVREERARLPFSLGVHPKLGVELAGPLLRISALASLQPGEMMCEPLTPFLNLLPTTAQAASLSRLVTTLIALKDSLIAIQRLYAEAAASAQPVDADDSALPYPLRAGSGYTRVQHLGNGRLLWSARDAQGRPVCVKFTSHAYPEAVHRAWAEARLAPVLFSVTPLPGGLHMVVMELLPAGEWKRLGEDRAAADEALQALSRAHALTLPCGRRTAHGDCRPDNVLVRRGEGGALDVRFVDFCWAGVEGVTLYPPFMSLDVNWPAGAEPGAPLAQAHDRLLLRAAAGLNRR